MQEWSFYLPFSGVEITFRLNMDLLSDCFINFAGTLDVKGSALLLAQCAFKFISHNIHKDNWGSWADITVSLQIWVEN